MNATLANRYEIDRSLGAGGFSETFLARDLNMPSKRLVVVKQLKPVDSPKTATPDLIEDLFKKEAAVLEELGNHCNQIPKLYSYFSDGGKFYLVQEYIEGKSLAQLGKISPEKAQKILRSLLETLNYVHSKSIIHRDIKPENIILREQDQLPVLIDFGAVKEVMGSATLASGSTTSSVVIGTRGFMAPEQVTGRAMFSSDLFALGLTIIYTLTQKSPVEFPVSPLTGELDWQSEVTDLPPNLMEILDKAIKIEASRRYPTAGDMLKDLDQRISPSSDHFSDSPIQPAPPISPNPPIPPTSPNPLLMMIIAGLLLALMGLGGGYFISQQINQAREAERRAQQAEEERIQAQKLAEQREADLRAAERVAKQREADLQEAQRLAEQREKERIQAQRRADQREAERREAEQRARDAEREAERNREVPPNPSSGGSGSLSWQSSCGDPYVRGYTWWAVKGPAGALGMVKNSYCGDAYISGRETQAASFRSPNEARRFANALTNSTGYTFYVKESQAR